MHDQIISDQSRKNAYDSLFYSLLPDLIDKHCPSIPYWPSSPHRPDGYQNGHSTEQGGDCHFWDVWHGRKNVKTYEQQNYRFYSEFGMQSYCSPETVRTFASKKEMNVYGPVMENHQKNGAGNSIILDYISRIYRFPNTYASLAYLSQLNQAYCMKVAVEHFRRNMPRTMGALYWQLNDCWPVASWSSIEFDGRWKALHFHARRFFNPVLVCAHVKGDEFPGITNRMINTINSIDIYTICDRMEPSEANLCWTLYNNLDNSIINQNKRKVNLRYGDSILQESVDFTEQIERFGRRNLYVRLFLDQNSRILSENTVLFTAPRFIEFKPSKISFTIEQLGNNEFGLNFTSQCFQYQNAFNLTGLKFRASDNYFDLYPGVSHRVEIKIAGKPIDIQKLSKKISVCSIVDSYY